MAVKVAFLPQNKVVEVPPGTTILEAAFRAGLELPAPCGGQGRCGRCRVQLQDGQVEQPPNAHLPEEDRARGYVLACQARLLGPTTVLLPEELRLERVISGVGVADYRALTPTCDWKHSPTLRALYVECDPPSLVDNTNDFDRLRRSLLRQHGIMDVEIDLPLLQVLPQRLRAKDWRVTAVLEPRDGTYRLVDVLPGRQVERIYGAAVDIGTTTVKLFLVDMATGQVLDSESAYNAQIARGEDIISRIIYAQKEGGLSHLQRLVLKTINGLLVEVARRQKVELREIQALSAAGNTTMTQLFLGINPKYIREEPYLPTITRFPTFTAGQIGLAINPNAPVYCAPSVGAYVGGDIVAGVLSSGMYQTDLLTLFIDVGTNGEIVLGNSDWLIACACSAGPAFEGAGVRCGMRATEGAIDEVIIDGRTLEPTVRVIGDGPAQGICGSGLISALAEMFITGVVDKAGRIRRDLPTRRIRRGEHGAEYVLVWGQDGRPDIVLTEVDINNLMRAKGAIYAGFSILLKSLELDFSMVEQILIAGSFGQYINLEKAIQIGLLPDLPWSRFRYLGNTSLLGAYQTLLCREMREVADQIASKMTYLELSADNRFMHEYTSALFLPHTNLEGFPSVQALLEQVSAAR
ncbi:MAG: ASKHA domain-containing protein [Chloroflexia bacterium]